MLSTLQAGMHVNHIGAFKKMYILGLIVTGQQGMGLDSACLQISCYDSQTLSRGAVTCGAPVAFPVVTVTNDLKLGGIHSRHLLPHSSRGQESEVKVPQVFAHSAVSKEEPCRLLSAWIFLACGYPIPIMPSSPVYLSVCFFF